MDVPSPFAGVVKDLKVAIGDKVSQDTLVCLLETARAKAGENAPAPENENPTPEATGIEPSASAAMAGDAEHIRTNVVVLGAGPGGYTAAFRSADLGLDTVLVERYDTLGGVCLNVGCIPSKALLHTAEVINSARGMADHGVEFGEPNIDPRKLADWKSSVVGKLTKGLAG